MKEIRILNMHFVGADSNDRTFRISVRSPFPDHGRLHTILLMPFSILPYELSAFANDLIVGFRPLRQGRQLWAGDLGKRTPVQSIEGQEGPVKCYRNCRARGKQWKTRRRGESILDKLNDSHFPRILVVMWSGKDRIQ